MNYTETDKPVCEYCLIASTMAQAAECVKKHVCAFISANMDEDVMNRIYPGVIGTGPRSDSHQDWQTVNKLNTAKLQCKVRYCETYSFEVLRIDGRGGDISDDGASIDWADEEAFFLLWYKGKDTAVFIKYAVELGKIFHQQAVLVTVPDKAGAIVRGWRYYADGTIKKTGIITFGQLLTSESLFRGWPVYLKMARETADDSGKNAPADSFECLNVFMVLAGGWLGRLFKKEKPLTLAEAAAAVAKNKDR